MDNVTPLQKAAGILGEHYENFLIAVNPSEDNTVCECEWNNPYAAKTLAEQARKLVKSNIYPVDQMEFVWEEEVEVEDDDDYDE